MSYNPIQRQQETKPGSIGSVAKVVQISPYEAKQQALYLLRSNRLNPGTILSNVIDLLATAGVYPEDQLMELTTASRRTLQRYRKKGYLDLVVTPHKLTKLFKEKLKIYCLGPIGLALAELRHGLVPTGYLKQGTDRITHDVLCNKVYYHLYQAARQVGYSAILKGKYEATIHSRTGQPILEPDSMVILAKEEENNEASGKEQIFLIEYHNEDFGSRAAEKVRKYEDIYREKLYRQWHTLKMPPILVVTTHRAVAVGYKETIDTRRGGAGINCTYLIKSLRTFLDQSQSPLVWLNLVTNKEVHLLTSQA